MKCYCTFTMDSLVCAMSVITPSEMMSRMKYCEPSVTAEAYLVCKEMMCQRSGDQKMTKKLPQKSTSGWKNEVKVKAPQTAVPIIST